MRPYVPASFEADGFVHCTDGVEEVAATANRYYSNVADLLVLTIDVGRLTSPVRYEDPGRIYPHVYGPIERGAILQVQPMRRASDSRWAPPA
jgi:uncharacterized protein (DUF952 family)